MPETTTRKFSENAALIILDFMTNQWGFRLSRSWVENALPEWVAAANVCDEAVPLKAGGTEPRWRLALSYSMSERPVDVLQRMLDACDGAIYPTSGRGLALKVGRWEEPTVTLDEDAIVAFSGLTRGGDVLTRATTVRARYTSRPHKYVEQDADPWVDDETASLAGEDGPDLSLFASPSHSQTRRIQKITYNRLNPNWRGTLACNLRGLAIMGERFIRVRLADYGIDETFEVQGQPAFVMAEGNVVKGIQVEVASMSAVAYAWNAATEEGTAPLVPEEIEQEEREIPVPTGFTMTKVMRLVAGNTLAFIRFTANAADFGGDTIIFEISTNGGTTHAEVPKDRSAVEAEYGPMQDDLTYIGRAVTVSATNRRGDPTATLTLSNNTALPLTPAAFTAVGSGDTASLSARAANDANTRSLQFRRGTTAQAFSAATVISSQLALANDVRALDDLPGFGTWRYWATALNASGVVAAAPAGPIDVFTIGPDLIINGGFATDTDWLKGTGWTISGGTLNKAATGASSEASQNIAFVAGGTYRVTFTIVSMSGGGQVYARTAGGTTVLGTTRTAAGTYTEDIVAGTGNVQFRILGTATAVATIDNVSIRRIA